MFKHILVPTDGSQFSQDTVSRAVSFAKEAGARITAFNAMREVPYNLGAKEVHMPSRTEEIEREEKEAQEILSFVENLCQEAGVPCAKLTLTNNVVYEAIIEAATQSGCDLIFMASHGRRGLSALLLGSETNKVLTHTKIPVLVFR
jgi:nucleotide-binding universal stress UspA family protein